MNVLEILKKQNIEILEEAINNGVIISDLDIKEFTNQTEEINSDFIEYLINNDFIKEGHLRTYDLKEGDNCPYNMEDMEYMCDGVWIHKDDCWW
jgi:hypothetical protein